MIKFYGYKKCGTCRKAEKALQDFALNYQFIDITENPPSASTLKKILKQSGVELKKLFNTSGLQYRELNIKNQLPHFSIDQAIDLLSKNGKLLKRPIVTDGKTTTIGFNPEEFTQTWTP